MYIQSHNYCRQVPTVAPNVFVKTNCLEEKYSKLAQKALPSSIGLARIRLVSVTFSIH